MKLTCPHSCACTRTHTRTPNYIIRRLRSTSCPAITLNEGTHNAHTTCCAMWSHSRHQLWSAPSYRFCLASASISSLTTLYDPAYLTIATGYCKMLFFFLSNWCNIKKFVYCIIPYIITLEEISVAYMKKHHYYSEQVSLSHQRAMALVCRTHHSC